MPICSLPKTIFCDIDGTILQHLGDVLKNRTKPQPLLPHVLLTFKTWDKEGHTIVLTTARKESERARTETQLRETGISYDHLLMGLPGGDRVLINDRKPNSDRDTAYAINLERNSGLSNIALGSKHVVIPDGCLERGWMEWAWGSEEVVEANARYIVKKVAVHAGKLSPLFVCRLRRKTLTVMEGTLCLKLGETEMLLGRGETCTVPAGIQHAFYAHDQDAVFIETSSHELWDTLVIKEDL